VLHNLRPNSHKRPNFLRKNFRNSGYADPKPGYDNARHYAIQITASQLLDKPRDASASVARG